MGGCRRWGRVRAGENRARRPKPKPIVTRPSAPEGRAIDARRSWFSCGLVSAASTRRLSGGGVVACRACFCVRVLASASTSASAAGDPVKIRKTKKITRVLVFASLAPSRPFLIQSRARATEPAHHLLSLTWKSPSCGQRSSCVRGSNTRAERNSSRVARLSSFSPDARARDPPLSKETSRDERSGTASLLLPDRWPTTRESGARELELEEKPVACSTADPF